MTSREAIADDLRQAYQHHVRDSGNEAALWATAAYIVTFLAVRAITFAIHRQLFFHDVVVGSLHIHHMVPGLTLLLISGILDLAGRWRLPRSVLFGVGAALVLDEFALMLTLVDVYWMPEGAISLVAEGLFLVVLLWNFWLGHRFVGAVAAILTRGAGST